MTNRILSVGDDFTLRPAVKVADANLPAASKAAAIALKADASALTAHTGNVANPHAVTKAQVGLGSVDNTTDTAKPVSAPQQAALDLKAPLASPMFTGTPTGITKTHVGLGNVDNTADAAKPISTAQAAGLALKAPIASPTFTGTVSGVTKTHVGLGSVDNTTDANKPVSTATATALAGKVKNGDLALNAKDYGAVCDGTTDDTTALQAAVTAAQGKVLVIPGACLVTANLTGLHGVVFSGSGTIVRSGVTFYTQPTGTQANTLYVAPAGLDTNDGLTTALPFLTFQAAFDALKLYGPVLGGNWNIVAAAGTYPISAAQQTLEVRSLNRVVVRGPVAGHPTVPTAIIDGAGGAAYKHGLSASGVGVRAEFRDLKFINFTAGGGDNSRIGCLGESESDVYFNNVHATGATWTGVYAFNTIRARMAGGIFDGCRAGFVANCTQATVTDSIIRNSTETGIYWSRGSQGHVDYVTFEDNAVGLRVAENSRVDTVANDFKRNSYGIRAQTGGLYGEGGAANIFNAGTADAQIFADIEHSAYSGNSVELETSQQYIRVAYDRAAHTHTGTTSITTLATPYTIPAKRLVGTGKQARIHVLGVFTTATSGTIMTASIGGMDVAFTVPAAASNVSFEIDLTLMEVAGGYRAIGKLSQGLNATRFATATSGFTSTSAQAIAIKATLANSADSIAIYRTDVYLMG